MAIEVPTTGKAKVSQSGDLLEISVPARKIWFALIFLPFWLCGWLFGEVMVITHLFFSGTPAFADLFLLAWLAMWTLGGGMAMFLFWWMAIGREIIIVDRGILKLYRAIGPMQRGKEYDINYIKHIDVADDPYAGWGYFNRGRMSSPLNSGRIKFDYGMKTIRFADGIEEAEARMLVGLLKMNRDFKEENFG